MAEVNQIIQTSHPWVVSSVYYRLIPEIRKVQVIGGYQMVVPEYVLGRLIVLTIGHLFTCDGFSVPGLLRWWQDPFCKDSILDAITHDWGYRENEPALPRREWDLVFREGMRASGVRMTKRRTLYRGVRLFGLPAWRRSRRGDQT